MCSVEEGGQTCLKGLLGDLNLCKGDPTYSFVNCGF